MKVTLKKDWGDYKAGDQVEIVDKTVLEAGYIIGLFIDSKKGNKKSKGEESEAAEAEEDV